jgi:hypothetical protein
MIRPWFWVQFCFGITQKHQIAVCDTSRFSPMAILFLMVVSHQLQIGLSFGVGVLFFTIALVWSYLCGPMICSIAEDFHETVLFTLNREMVAAEKACLVTGEAKMEFDSSQDRLFEPTCLNTAAAENSDKSTSMRSGVRPVTRCSLIKILFVQTYFFRC